MTEEEFVKNVRQDIREEGFMSAVKLTVRIMERAVDFKLPDIKPQNILPLIPCEDIKVVKYRNWMTRDYRRKDLLYHDPVQT